ncbi:MAG: PKD domain-containing protein [Bacteroidota bacterium]
MMKVNFTNLNLNWNISWPYSPFKALYSLLLVGCLLGFQYNTTSAQVFVDLDITNASCNGAADGAVTATGGGGWAPYTYTWSNGATGPTISGLTSGTYAVTVIDIDLGQAIGTAFVGAINIFTTASFETCVGSNDATATVVASGGTQPYTYLWSDGQTTDIATNLSAGTYTVTVTDATGATCVGTQVVDLSPEGVWIMLTSTDADCGENNGTAYVGVMTGTPPFTFMWSNGDTTNNPMNLAAGTYTVTVTDANGCFSVGSVDVNSVGFTPDAGSISTNDTTEFCVTDGIPDIVNVIATGNTAPNFRFVVTDAAGTILLITTDSQFDFEGTGIGTCLIWGLGWEGTLMGAEVGGNANTILGCFDLTEPISVTRTDCNNCVIDPGFIETDDPTSICVQDGIPDPINVTVTGNTGTNNAWIITDNAGVILDLPAGPPFDLSPAPPGRCLIWHITFEDGLTGLEIGNTAPTDLNGCFKLSNPIPVDRNIIPVVTVSPTDAETCPGDGVQLTATVNGNGPFTYEWTASGGSFDDPTSATPIFTMMMPGLYTVTVTVTDVNGCQATVTTSITVNPNPTVDINPQNAAVCRGESVSFTTSAAGTNLTYSWTASGGSFDDPSSANPTYTMMMPGTYDISVTVTNASGCAASATTTVTINDLPDVDISPSDAAICPGGTVQLTANATGAAPLTYSWTASGGSFDDASIASPTYTMMMPGTYDISVEVTDANGCQASATTTVTVNPNPEITVTPSSEICPGDDVQLMANATGNGPFTYSWTATGGSFDDPSSPSPTYTMMMPGTYDITVEVTDANGCQATATTSVTVNPNPTIDLMPQGAVICSGESIQLNANATGALPLTYSWTASGGSFDDPTSATPTYTMMMGGTYDITVEVTDANGCSAMASTTITVERPDAGTLTIDADPVCLENGIATISATPDGNANVPAGYETIFVLTSQPGLIIRQTSSTPSFDVTMTGDYVIHTLIYDPNTLDLSIITPGVTTGVDVNGLLVQGGGSICASLDVTGAPVNVFARKIGDFVWIDENKNGIQDTNEDGFEGATVTLLMAGPDGLYCTADDIEVDKDTTDSHGFYCFECVLPGEYSVLFEINDTTYEFTQMDAGSFDDRDSDADQATGKTDPFTINPGDGDDLTIDAGVNLICVNYTVGGQIAANQFGLCPGTTPQKLTSVSLPTGGFGPIVYMWMYIELSNLTNPDPVNWIPIPNSNSPMYQPFPVTETTLFARCARAEDCPNFVESNIVRVEVIDCIGNINGVNLNANVFNQLDVMLDWTVGPEDDRYNYYIERSIDGVNFEKIGQLTGKGDARVDNAYEYMDKLALKGRNYYRVKQVGLTSTAYSQVVDIMVGLRGMEEVYAYPNPFQGTLNIETLADFGNSAIVEIINTNGQVVQQLEVNPKNNIVEFNSNRLDGGLYFVRVRSLENDKIPVIKVLKQY